MMKRIIFLMMLFITTLTYAMQKTDIDWHNRELIIRGDFLRAVLVAHEDFSKRMAERHSETVGSESKADKELSLYLSNIENYNIEVGFGHNRYLVWINPRSSDTFPAIFGSDALYIINAKTFELLERKYGK